MKQNQQNDKPKPRIITLKQFLRYFEEQQNRKFCFILGAGASKSSGISTGAELASRWLNEIEEDLIMQPLTAIMPCFLPFIKEITYKQRGITRKLLS